MAAATLSAVKDAIAVKRLHPLSSSTSRTVPGFDRNRTQPPAGREETCKAFWMENNLGEGDRQSKREQEKKARESSSSRTLKEYQASVLKRPIDGERDRIRVGNGWWFCN